jgi:methylenetetrahydrofolate dehydrogenase (NADP+)/methenyltetrahydrofolate cyclohydrolase
MVAQIIDGKKIASKLLEEVKKEIEKRTNQGERHPCLAVILIGNNPASHVYVKNKKLACEKVGIHLLLKKIY